MTNALMKNGLFGCELSGAFAGLQVAFEEAWTRALMTTGTVSAEDVNAALASLDADGFRVTNNRDGLPVPSLAAQLRSKLFIGASSAIQTGSTSKDVIDTAMVLSALASARQL